MAREQRRLAAIVSADVVGYSILMGLDDSRTLAQLKAHRREFIDPKIAENRGRIVNTAGDNLLLEFPSVIDAVLCAVEIQRGMTKRNAEITPDHRIDFRIGINIGDIIIDGNEIYGDGVNVAARLQALAEPGGICVSRPVRDQVRDKLSFTFEDLGAQQVKNISRPVEVYRIKFGSEMSEMRGRPRWLRSGQSRLWQLIGAGVVIVSLASLLVWSVPQLWKHVAPASPPAMSVAVAPLAAPMGDAEVARFANALTRDLASSVSRVYGWAGRLHVVAFRGDSADEVIDLSKVRRQLNVRYVLEGNVLRSGETNTVSLQLIDAVSGAQVWSDRATVHDSDVLAESSLNLRYLAVRVRIALLNAEMRRVLAQPESDLSAHELVLRAMANPGQVRSLGSVREALKRVNDALRLDPSSVPALMVRSVLDDDEIGLNPKADRSRLVREMDEDTARAVELDRTNPTVWFERAFALLRLERWDAALEAIDTAIKLDPNDPAKLVARAQIMNTIGRPTEALALSDRAKAIDKEGVQPFVVAECESHLLLGQAEQAVAVCEKAAAFSYSWIAKPLLVAAYADIGDIAKATTAKAELLRLIPGYTVAQARAYDQPSHPEYAKLAEKYYYEGLRKAGVPEN